MAIALLVLSLVTVETGQVRGVETGNLVAYKGIPYAAPPVGTLRWKPPAPAIAWTGVRDATAYGSACVQAGTPADPSGAPSGSEDCLTLNVWAPKQAPKTPLPVMVFVHGGYFTWGSSGQALAGVDVYDGAQLAAKANAIVVTLNYRLGPFGFIAHELLAAEDAHRTTGDYGLLDQIAALKWVATNIAAFGGDAKRVTLFGQSAGGISVAALVASPFAKGLFARAIVQSGNSDAHPIAKALAGGAELAKRLGCKDLACLRSKSATDVAAAMPETYATGYMYGPVVDGYVLPRKPIEIVERGEHNHVPLIVSTTSTEFSTMIAAYVDGPLVTPADYAKQLEKRFGAKLAASLAKTYPIATYGSALAAYTAVWSDASFICQSDWLAQAATAKQTQPVARFIYDHVFDGPLTAARSGHGLDLFLIFKNVPATYLKLSKADLALSDTMIAYWSGAKTWKDELVVDTTFHRSTSTRDTRCAMWKLLLR